MARKRFTAESIIIPIMLKPKPTWVWHWPKQGEQRKQHCVYPRPLRFNPNLLSPTITWVW